MEPGESKEQRAAEAFMLKEISRILDAQIVPKRVPLANGAQMDVDGICEDPPILCEAWAHIGPPKSAQKTKVLADAFKLLFLEEHLGRKHSKLLLFADETARRAFAGPTWRAAALQHFGIETRSVELTAALRDAVLRAQGRQYR